MRGRPSKSGSAPADDGIGRTITGTIARGRLQITSRHHLESFEKTGVLRRIVDLQGCVRWHPTQDFPGTALYENKWNKKIAKSGRAVNFPSGISSSQEVKPEPTRGESHNGQDPQFRECPAFALTGSDGFLRSSH